MIQSSTRRARNVPLLAARLNRASWTCCKIATFVRLKARATKLRGMGTSWERRQPMCREAPSRWMPARVRTEPSSSTRRSTRTWKYILHDGGRWSGSRTRTRCQKARCNDKRSIQQSNKLSACDCGLNLRGSWCFPLRAARLSPLNWGSGLCVIHLVYWLHRCLSLVCDTTSSSVSDQTSKLHGVRSPWFVAVPGAS